MYLLRDLQENQANYFNEWLERKNTVWPTKHIHAMNLISGIILYQKQMEMVTKWCENYVTANKKHIFRILS